MLFNRTQAAGQNDRSASRVPIIDPAESGSSFYTVPDPYEEGRRRRRESEEHEGTPER